MGALVVLEDSGVTLGGRSILRGLSLSLGAGEVLGAALGSAEVYQVRRQIGMIGHTPAVIGELSLRENLEHAIRLAGADPSRIEPALRVVGLDEAAHRTVETSSHGMLRRTEVARLLITEPRLLLLDEAYSGLDFYAQELIDALIERATADGGAVVVVSHDLRHLAERAGRVLNLSAGRLEPVP